MSAAGAPVVVVAAVELPSERLDIEERILGHVGATVLDLRARPLASIRAELIGAAAVMTEGIERLDAETIRSLKQCRVISIYAVGTDRIDVAAAEECGIAVANVPDYCTTEVAEHTMALILAVWRKLPRAERLARRGTLALDGLLPLHRLEGRTLGLLGLGRIAREVAVRANAFGLRVIAHDPHVTPATAASFGVEVCSFDDLLAASDVLSLHVPLSDDTRGCIDSRALSRMPKGAFLVNAGRGGVVDETALLDALSSGHLAGAALDVLTSEPVDPAHPLLALENVIVTPHMAYYSEEALVALRVATAENALAVLRGAR
ncbi:MAG: C-terminal binding protein [Gaiella sp.]